MAIDNLNYYSSWLPAWQQTDKYSSQPWCLKSKNLDIFSSSKSVKATAWSQPSTADADIVAQDSKWHLVLKTDWKVYEDGTLFIDPSATFPVHDVSYTWYGWTYAPAERWTPQDMVVKYDWDEWRSFVVYTDTSSFVYSKEKFIFNKSFVNTSTHITYEGWWYWNGYLFKKKADDTAATAHIYIQVENAPFTNIPVRIFAVEYDNDESNISLDNVEYREANKLYYDAHMDSIVPDDYMYGTASFTWSITSDNWVEVNIPITPTGASWIIDITVRWTAKPSQTRSWNNGDLYVDINWWPQARRMMKKADGTISDWDCNYYYTYLPLRERKLTDIWSYGYSSSYWMKGQTFQPLYKRTGSWVEKWYWNWKLIYDFVEDMWWESDPAMDIIWMITRNEQVYMIWNLDWNGYIIPCDLTWWRWTPYIAYWCTFKGVTNIDYLMYLVWEDRGVSTLWVFNQQELVPVIWWNKEETVNDVIWVDEQYKFDWSILNWRKNLILTTTDNRIFQYGKTYGGKWWAFIHELPSEATITWLKANWNDLEISYSITEWQTTTNYTITYQDDTPIKNYNLEWMAEYPIVLWNHLLEKEESDLYVSYILPSADCSLEFWGMANHYHFWTFTSEDDYTFDSELSYKMKWATWDYELKFIERNENQYTFRLEGDLPIQTTNDMKITDTEWTELINYSEYNHFRKIWTIETDKYCEWEFRFHNLNNKLELPKSHSLQIMVKGKGNQNYTPELFALDLVANQRERW